MTDADLSARGMATLVASWEAYARGSDGASVERLDGVSIAVFPRGAERAFYNNALLEPGAPVRAVDAVEATYRAAGIGDYAAWVHESDAVMSAELTARGYTVAETTRAMGLSLENVSFTGAALDIAPASWSEYLRLLGVPGLLEGVDPTAFHIHIAQRAGENVASALAFDHAGDCGVFNVTTLTPARRRGIGTALTAQVLRDAALRGCSTASLQSTPVAERVYAALGFRDLGRLLEYAPPALARG